jgi:hypothetical protein
VTTFNTGVQNCDQGNYASCVSGIITGLLVTAASLWAPLPFVRREEGYANLTIGLDQYDPTSSHPAHRFIGHYNNITSQNPNMTGNVGYISYAKTADTRHRLIVSPRSTGIGRRQGQSDTLNDGSGVSYEWK